MDTATEIDRRLAGDMQWSGYLTRSNIVQVADRIRRLLTGKRYAFVVANEFGMLINGRIVEGPDVRIEQLSGENPVKVHLDDLDGFTVHDTYGLWMVYTDAADRKLAYDIVSHEAERNHPPYIVFNHDRVEIRHHAPAGQVLVWTAVVCGDADLNLS